MEKAKNNKTKINLIKVLRFCIFITTVAIVFSLAFGGIMIRKNPDYIPTMLGHTYLNVLSDSMAPEFKVNDLVIGGKVKSATDIKIGDIITFREGRMLVTHRITAIENGTFITKGDANEAVDREPIVFEQVVSKTKLIIPKAGIIVAKFQDFGFLAMLWLIFMYFILKELIIEIKKIRASKKEKSDVIA